ncbi:MAG: ribosomal protein S18-alanine N-acetyltransferase [Hylemonella sp.]|nr:ribosomal protein S18-alanine N-acetyltransferase [Hylemonella sp.]
MTRRFEWVPLSADVLPLVAEVEKTAYSHPWTVGHFSDTMNAGHHTQVLAGEALASDVGLPTLADGRVLIGYLVAMQILDEVHLLNLTVAPALQRQGWGRVLLDALALWARGQQAQWLWLEVRASNVAALAAYRQRGFAEVGRRRDYYPLDNSRREDAIVMSLNLKVTP